MKTLYESAQVGVYFPGLGGCGRVSGSDRPNRLVGHYQTRHLRLGDGLETGRELAADDLLSLAGLSLSEELADAEDRWTIGGYYTNELVRTADGWKLAKVTLIVTWQTGNPDVSRIAFKRGRAIEASESGS